MHNLRATRVLRECGSVSIAVGQRGPAELREHPAIEEPTLTRRVDVGILDPGPGLPQDCDDPRGQQRHATGYTGCNDRHHHGP
jgi:hypothetical protein